MKKGIDVRLKQLTNKKVNFKKYFQYRLATDHARLQTELRARQEDPTTVMAR